jgi:hypothetical protein
MKLGVKELIKLCIYCWGHPLLYTCSGSVAVWMLLSGNLQQAALCITLGGHLTHVMSSDGQFMPRRQGSCPTCPTPHATRAFLMLHDMLHVVPT